MITEETSNKIAEVVKQVWLAGHETRGFFAVLGQEVKPLPYEKTLADVKDEVLAKQILGDALRDYVQGNPCDAILQIGETWIIKGQKDMPVEEIMSCYGNSEMAEKNRERLGIERKEYMMVNIQTKDHLKAYMWPILPDRTLGEVEIVEGKNDGEGLFDNLWNRGPSTPLPSGDRQAMRS